MKLILAIVIGGLVAGALDIAYACIHYGIVYDVPPERIFQSVAAGWMGREAATSGGVQTAAIGLGSHFMIAIAMAAVFVIAARAVPALTRFAWITGPLYGIALLFVMNYIVVPNSAVGGEPGLPEGQFLYGAIAAHALLVGLPIALIARVFERR